MKKIIIVLIGIVLVSSALAVFNTRQDAFDFFYTMKSIRENDISQSLTTAKYTSDLLCEINYDSEDISGCNVCFEFNYLQNTYDDCIVVGETATKKEIDALVDEQIKSQINSINPPVSVQYKALDLKDVEISIGEQI